MLSKSFSCLSILPLLVSASNLGPENSQCAYVDLSLASHLGTQATGHLNLVNLERFPLLVTPVSMGRLRLPLWTFDEDKLFEKMENEGSFHAPSSWFFLRQQITSIVASCGFTT